MYTPLPSPVATHHIHTCQTKHHTPQISICSSQNKVSDGASVRRRGAARRRSKRRARRQKHVTDQREDTAKTTRAQGRPHAAHWTGLALSLPRPSRMARFAPRAMGATRSMHRATESFSVRPALRGGLQPHPTRRGRPAGTCRATGRPTAVLRATGEACVQPYPARRGGRQPHAARRGSRRSYPARRGPTAAYRDGEADGPTLRNREADSRTPRDVGGRQP